MLSGWEKAVFYQYCMNQGYLKAKVINEYSYDTSYDNYIWALRLTPLFITMILPLVEFTIYTTIIWHLWKHDKRSVENQTITNRMRQDRTNKNVITLSGQAGTFVVEFVVTIYVIINVKYLSIADPSLMPIILTITNTVLSISQFVTSHELKRFVKSVWYKTIVPNFKRE